MAASVTATRNVEMDGSFFDDLDLSRIVAMNEYTLYSVQVGLGTGGESHLKFCQTVVESWAFARLGQRLCRQRTCARLTCDEGRRERLAAAR